jgi:RNA polymerase sigma-70 factor (ECF subfamily)
MSDSSQNASLPPALQELVRELYQKSGSEKFGLDQQGFAVIVSKVGEKYLAPNTTPAEIRNFYLSLKVEELALAHACARGNDRAWETFLLRYREKLYDMALQIAREASGARELADSLYADLYGVNTRGAERTSKLASYTGRGSLEGWLRTVMAQEHVNRYRRQKRLVSLDEESEEGNQFAAPDPQPTPLADSRIESATDEALSTLSPEDQFVLAAYYIDGRTLAEIARMLHVHESTISRKLDKLAKSLRKQVLSGLSRRGMTRRQALEALEVDVRDLRVDIRKKLTQDPTLQSFPEKKIQAGAGDGSG